MVGLKGQIWSFGWKDERNERGKCTDSPRNARKYPTKSKDIERKFSKIGSWKGLGAQISWTFRTIWIIISSLRWTPK